MFGRSIKRRFEKIDYLLQEKCFINIEKKVERSFADSKELHGLHYCRLRELR